MGRDTMPLGLTLGALDVLPWLECRYGAAPGTRDGRCYARHTGVTARAVFKKLQSILPVQCSVYLLQTLQRPAKASRNDKAQEMLFFGTRRHHLITDHNGSDGAGAGSANNNNDRGKMLL